MTREWRVVWKRESEPGARFPEWESLADAEHFATIIRERWPDVLYARIEYRDPGEWTEWEGGE